MMYTSVHRSATTFKQLLSAKHWLSRYNAMFCWESLSLGIHVDATWHTPPPGTLDQVHLPMAGTPQQNIVSWYTSRTAQEMG